MLNALVSRGLTGRSRKKAKYWSVVSVFGGSLGFLLFQGGKLAFMLFVMITIISVYLLLGQWSGIKRTTGTRHLGQSEFGTQLEAGHSLNVRIQLQIPGYWPIPYVFVKDRLLRRNGGELSFEATVVTDWRRRAIWEYRTPALRRGMYSFGQTDCVTEDVFGLFQHKGSPQLPSSFVVMPKTVAIRDWTQQRQLTAGTNHHSSSARAVRETTQINGVREYIYGDRISRIHWNATAKTGTWKSKEFEREALPQTFLVLDRHKTSYKDLEWFELAVSAAASMFQYGTNRGFGMGLLSSGSSEQFIDPKSGKLHNKSLQQHLIDVEADGPKRLAPVVMNSASRIPAGSFVAVISPASGEPMRKALLWLKTAQLNPCHIWICPDAERSKREAWLHQLRAMGMAGYPVASLTELPVVLGGRSQ